jgi:hypothetical protein
MSAIPTPPRDEALLSVARTVMTLTGSVDKLVKTLESRGSRDSGSSEIFEKNILKGLEAGLQQTIEKALGEKHKEMMKQEGPLSKKQLQILKEVAENSENNKESKAILSAIEKGNKIAEDTFKSQEKSFKKQTGLSGIDRDSFWEKWAKNRAAGVKGSFSKALGGSIKSSLQQKAESTGLATLATIIGGKSLYQKGSLSNKLLGTIAGDKAKSTFIASQEISKEKEEEKDEREKIYLEKREKFLEERSKRLEARDAVATDPIFPDDEPKPISPDETPSTIASSLGKDGKDSEEKEEEEVYQKTSGLYLKSIDENIQKFTEYTLEENDVYQKTSGRYLKSIDENIQKFTEYTLGKGRVIAEETLDALGGRGSTISTVTKVAEDESESGGIMQLLTTLGPSLPAMMSSIVGALGSIMGVLTPILIPLAVGLLAAAAVGAAVWKLSNYIEDKKAIEETHKETEKLQASTRMKEGEIKKLIDQDKDMTESEKEIEKLKNEAYAADTEMMTSNMKKREGLTEGVMSDEEYEAENKRLVELRKKITELEEQEKTKDIRTIFKSEADKKEYLAKNPQQNMDENEVQKQQNMDENEVQKQQNMDENEGYERLRNLGLNADSQESINADPKGWGKEYGIPELEKMEQEDKLKEGIAQVEMPKGDHVTPTPYGDMVAEAEKTREVLASNLGELKAMIANNNKLETSRLAATMSTAPISAMSGDAKAQTPNYS